MKRSATARLLTLTLSAILALAMPLMSVAEELDEISLYDPLVHADDGTPVPGTDADEPAGELPADPDAPAAADDPDSPGTSGSSGTSGAAGTSETSGAADTSDPPAADDAPGTTDLPAADDTPGEGDAPVSVAVPAADDTPGNDSAPADNNMSADNSAPGEGEIPGEPDAYAVAAAPAGDETPGEGDASADGTDVDPATGESPAAVPAAAPDLTMGVGERFTPDWVQLIPGGGQTCTLTSSDEETVEVEALTGTLTAKKTGAAEILITAETGETATYRVAVLEAPDAAAFTASSVLLGKGESRAMQVKLPEGTASARLAYASSKTSVVAVDANGRITARKTGTAWIAATTYNGKRALCKVVVRSAPKKVTLSAGSMAVCVDESSKLTAKLPKNTASGLVWVSSDPAVATVDAGGNVRGVSLGTATVTVTTFNGKRASCSVRVLEGDPPTTLTLNVTGLYLGKKESFRLIPAIGEGEETVYAFATSNKKIATVSQSGVVTAKKKGTAKIAVRTHNGLTRVIKVKVSNAPKKISLSRSALVLNMGQTASLSTKLTKKTYSQRTWWTQNAAVATVEGGVVTAVGPGVTNVAVRTYNNKKAYCKVTVLAGSPPTELHLNATSVQMGVKERFLISPTVGPGEEAVYTFATSNKKIATVTQNGVVTAKKKGTVKIGVKTHNGLVAVVTVRVYAAPTKIALSSTKLSLQPGQTAQLAYKVSGASAQVMWACNNESVVTVDDSGLVTAVNDGTALVGVKTYNGVKAFCSVTVTSPASTPEPTPEPTPAGDPPAGDPAEDAGNTPEQTPTPTPEPTPTPTPVVLAPSAAKMIANLRADNSLGLGSKKDAIIGVIELLLANGFEPAFAAGVASNVYSEGTYGLFESSKYISNPQKRPRYFAYLDGGDFYAKVNGEYVVSAVYLSQEEYDSYTGTATKYLRYGAKNYYMDNFGKRYAYNVNLNELEAFLNQLAKGNWTGKFGLGVVQWTGGRTKTLVSFYRKHAGSGSSSISKAQVIAAENEMILYELKGSYKKVYTAWLDANSKRDTAAAADSAGRLVCTKYEVPADKETKAITRGAKASAIYKVMIGG